MHNIIRFILLLQLSIASLPAAEAAPIPDCGISPTTQSDLTSRSPKLSIIHLHERSRISSLSSAPIILAARTTESNATPTYFSQAQETTKSGLSANTKTGIIIGGIASCIIAFFVITGVTKRINRRNRKPGVYSGHRGRGATPPSSSGGGDNDDGDNVIHLRPPPPAHVRRQGEHGRDPAPLPSSSPSTSPTPIVAPVARRQWGGVRFNSPSPSTSPAPSGRRWRWRDEPPPAYEP